MTIGRNPEYAAGARWRRNARAPKLAAASIATLATNSWSGRDGSPMGQPPGAIASAGNGSMERNFAEAATQHGFKRARWRGLARQTIQDQFIAALQNFKILLRRGGLDPLALLELLQSWVRTFQVFRSDFLFLTKVSFP